MHAAYAKTGPWAGSSWKSRDEQVMGLSSAVSLLTTYKPSPQQHKDIKKSNHYCLA